MFFYHASRHRCHEKRVQSYNKLAKPPSFLPTFCRYVCFFMAFSWLHGLYGNPNTLPNTHSNTPPAERNHIFEVCLPQKFMQKMRRFSNSPHGMPFHKNTMMAKNLTFVRLVINKLRHRIFIPK